MNQLNITDLFKDFGKNFDYTTRFRDQEKLLERLQEFPVLQTHSEELKDFTAEGIASLNYLEYFFQQLTKTCSLNNIQMT